MAGENLVSKSRGPFREPDTLITALSPLTSHRPRASGSERCSPALRPHRPSAEGRLESCPARAQLSLFVCFAAHLSRIPPLIGDALRAPGPSHLYSVWSSVSLSPAVSRVHSLTADASTTSGPGSAKQGSGTLLPYRSVISGPERSQRAQITQTHDS